MALNHSGERILVVEDDPVFRGAMIDALGLGGRAGEASTAAEAFTMAIRDVPDLVIVDLGLPDGDGAELCRRLRNHENTAGISIVVLTGDTSEGRDAACLDAGADSYLAKPVKGPRLRSYVRALLRRRSMMSRRKSRPMRAAGLEFHYKSKVMRLGEKNYAEFSPREFEVLYALALSHPDPMGRGEIYRRVWGLEPPSDDSLRTVEVHISRIREKLGPRAREKLATVPGRGYRLV
jgi:DNA-binding response OmpR family regulator